MTSSELKMSTTLGRCTSKRVRVAEGPGNTYGFDVARKGTDAGHCIRMVHHMFYYDRPFQDQLGVIMMVFLSFCLHFLRSAGSFASALIDCALRRGTRLSGITNGDFNYLDAPAPDADMRTPHIRTMAMPRSGGFSASSEMGLRCCRSGGKSKPHRNRHAHFPKGSGVGVLGNPTL